MQIDVTTKYIKPCEATLVFEEYYNKETAISLQSKRGEPLLFATVWVVDAYPEPDEVVIKDYSENEGILACLIEQGVIEPPTRSVPTGFVEVHVCKLTKKALEWKDSQHSVN